MFNCYYLLYIHVNSMIICFLKKRIKKKMKNVFKICYRSRVSEP